MTLQEVLQAVHYAYGLGYEYFQGEDLAEWSEECDAVLRWIEEKDEAYAQLKFRVDGLEK